MALQGLEYMVHEKGINPLKLRNIRGLAAAIERNPQVLESELTELAIEHNEWFNHSAMHAALHVGMVSPSDGRTITRTSAGASNGPPHQAQTGRSV